MSTPTFNLPTPPAAGAIAEALRTLEKERTPEVDCFTHFEHDYKYICEQEHRLLTHVEVDQLRDSIMDTEYHEVEINFYRSIYAQIVHDKLLSKHKKDGKLTLDGLRGMKASYIRMLSANGLTGNTLREKRLEITNQKYWKPEAEFLQQKASLREHEMLVELARQHAETKATSGSRRASPRRSSRITTRANTTQSLLKSESRPKPTVRIAGRVVKHKGKGGPKSRHP